MAYRRAKEKLGRIDEILATYEGDVRDRLKSAHKDLRALGQDEVPEDMREELQGVKDWLVRHGPLRDRYGVAATALEHTLRRSRNKTAKNIARTLHSLKRRIDKV